MTKFKWNIKSMLVLFFAIFSISVFSADLFKPGKYLGTAEGYGGPIKVEVETSQDKILGVKVVSHGETKGISDLALEDIPKEIVKYQSIAVEAVAGATHTSEGIKEAVKAALTHSGVDMKKISTPIQKETVPSEPPSEKKADVVIIGAGGAGLAAGVSAYENGAKSVIILEKMPSIGGNTIRSGGAMNAVYPEKQKKQGIEDSVEKHFTQTWEGGNKVANPKLVHVLTDHALEGVLWLQGYGMKWKEKIGSVVGSMWPRTNQSEDILGTGYINTLDKAFEKFGGKIYTNTKATHLIKDGDRVVGVIGVNKDGQEEKFLASQGVVIATGGYAANLAMVKEYLSDGVYTKENFPANIESTNHPGATGDGIVMGKEAGAELVDMKHVQLLPMPADRFGPTINVDDVIFINEEGKRYVREDGRRDEICLATFKQKDGKYYMINDSQIIPPDRKTTSGENLDELIRRGKVVEAPTLKELAEKIHVPATALEQSVKEFNDSVDKKSDSFGRQIWEGKIVKGPFYATLRYPALHHTMGGLKINEEAEVLGPDDKPIPGLYAAGEVTGGIHGANRLGGNAIADIIVFGRIAGKNAAKNVNK